MSNINTNTGTVFYSPTGNPELWETKPDGYFATIEEFEVANPPATPSEQELKAVRIQEIHSQLDEIDTKSVRPTRSIEVKRANNKANSLDVDAGLKDELTTLSGLETQALELRMELHVLENSTSAIKQTEEQTETSPV